jgi:hypothetical protein
MSQEVGGGRRLRVLCQTQNRYFLQITVIPILVVYNEFHEQFTAPVPLNSDYWTQYINIGYKRYYLKLQDR